jgi:hypothetical protein
MEKSIFKEGDKVFDIRYGWGVVNSINKWDLTPIYVIFGNEQSCTYNDDGIQLQHHPPFLSFTKYTFEGFSQERPEELPKKGQIVWGRNEFPSEWHIGYFQGKRGDKYLMSSNPKPTGLKNEVTQIAIKNPYENEIASI